MKLVILKIGGSVVTNKFSKKPRASFKNLRIVSKEIASAYNLKKMPLLLIHGAGSFGHLIVKKTGIDKGIKNIKQLKAFAETQRLQNKLNLIVMQFLISENLPVISYQASAGAVMRSGRLVQMDISTLKGLLEIGMIPVLYGVPAYDENQKCSILSGDQIAGFLAKKLNAKIIMHGTDVGGVFTEDPHLDPSATLIPEINSKNIDQVKKYLRGPIQVDVTGGMIGKISEIIKSGVRGQVFNALNPGNIHKALNGEKIGTTIEVIKN
jgi:isopentenyl phosphate kinase